MNKIKTTYMAWYIKDTFFFFLVIVFMASCQFSNKPKYEDGAVSPDEALATFDVEPGFKIELIAAEPLVSDPVDMEIDEYGRLYVVEMHGYPLDKNKAGRIVQLSDEDGDGVMDKSTVFMDGLVFPNGIMRWKKGFIVTDAPNVYYIEDTDGDGKADKKEVLLTGFSLSNPHVNVNNPIYGIDNWVYLAHFGAIGARNYKDEFGDQGTEIYSPMYSNGPRLPQNANGRTVRFHPDRKDLQMTASRAQFGHTFDAWGHRLMADNGNHAYHEVIDNTYLERNPNLLVSSATQSISDHGDVAEVFQITINPDRQLFSGVGVMTSASGITAYLGGAFPSPFNEGVTFVTESVSNLVHADFLTDDGASFIASRIGRKNREFLASTDSWFRPVNMYVGPDGALYVLDYYRKIIEHPEWMSDEAIKEGGLYKGNDMGRIYRISATDAEAINWTQGVKLGDASTAELVSYLGDKNNWWRLNAQRLLLDQKDDSAVPMLMEMAGNAEYGIGRLHARWTLAGLNKLTYPIIREGLLDPIAGNRENAIKIAEKYIQYYPNLIEDLIKLKSDSNAKVRFQLLCTLGEIENVAVIEARNTVLFNDIDDPWVQIAALSAPTSQANLLLDDVLVRFRSDKPAYSDMVSRLSEMMGATASIEEIRELIDRALNRQTKGFQVWQSDILYGLASGIKRNEESVIATLHDDLLRLVKESFQNPFKPVRDGCFQMIVAIGVENQEGLKPWFDQASIIAADDKKLDEARIEALRFMGLQKSENYVSLLESVANSGSSSAVQKEALRTFSRVPGTGSAQFVLGQWAFMTPDVRDVALDVFLTENKRIDLLLNALEQGAIQKTELGWGRTSRLMSLEDEARRNKARSLLTKDDDSEVIESYKSALELKGDAVKGKAVFTTNCSLCHQMRGELGVHYGPDMGTVHNWLPKNILANILAPNLSIAAGFDLWEIEMKSGDRIQGLLSSESSSAVTLFIAPGIAKTYDRKDVTSLKALNSSAMTANLSEQISQQEMADLIAFLKEHK